MSEEEVIVEESAQAEEPVVVEELGYGDFLPGSSLAAEQPSDEAPIEETGEEGEPSEESTDEAPAEPSGESAPEEEMFVIDEQNSIPMAEARKRLAEENKIRQRYGEIGSREENIRRREAALQKDLQTVKQYMGYLKTEDKTEAINNMLVAAGEDPSDWWTDFYAQTQERYNELNSLSDSERELARLKQKNEFLQRQREEEKRLQQAQATEQQYRTKIASVKQQHGISDQEWTVAQQTLLQAVQRGQFPQLQNASVEDAISAVAQACVTDKRVGRLEQALERIAPDLKSNETVLANLYGQIFNPLNNYQVSDADIEDVIRGAYLTDAKPETNGKPSVKKDEVRLIEETVEPDALDEVEPVSFL